MTRVLLVDDEPGLCHVVKLLLGEHGYTVDVAESGGRALELAKLHLPDAALIDVNLPGMNGLATFAALRQIDPLLPAVFMTAFATVPSAIAAMKAGASDYVTKPFDNDELLLTLGRAVEVRRLVGEVRSLREEISGRETFPGIVGRSAAVRDMLRLMPRIARTETPVLILGESGTGKELVARSLHQHSPRARGAFVTVNCAAIPAGLVESEFFGYERGAFTDAKESRAGKFELAHQGSLFLDEVGELPKEAQAKLLRALEEGAVTRVGGRRPTPVDVRILAATNRDLGQAVRQGTFREDLYWRLNVVPVVLPPLRERGDDIALFIDYFIERLNRELGTQIAGVTPEARTALLAHDWPGNVREFQNVMKRAMILADGAWLGPSDFGSLTADTPALSTARSASEGTLAEIVARTVSRVERALIETTLTRCRGNRMATADALGINRKTLFYKMRDYGLVDAQQIDEDA